MAENIIVDRFLDAGEEPVETLTPITGYETVELVSLEDAVKPLQSLLHNLDAMVQTAKRNSRKPANGLTQDESAAIRLYTIQWPKPQTSLYTLLNQRLRSQDRDTLSSWYLYLKLFLTALDKLPSVNMPLIWRGIRGNLSDQYEEDQIWWGFSSCTENIKVMEKIIGLDGVRTLFSIECIKGKAIRAHSQYQLENEILLMPGTYLRVVGKFSPSTDVHIIHLRETIAPYQTIAPLVNPCLQVVQTPSSVNLTTFDETDNTSSDSRTSEQSLVSISSEPKATTSKPKRTSIATQLPQYQNSRLEQTIVNNGTASELKLVLMDLKDQDMELVAHFALRNNTTLHVLNISSNDIGDKGTQHLSSGLRRNKTLTKLYLYNNRIGAKGVEYLSEALKNNTTLNSLNLSSNQIGDEGVQYLSDALQNNATLTELYLSFNQIGEEGAKYLSNLLKNGITLVVLDFSSNEIGNKGVQYLSDGLQNNKTLCKLDLSSNEIGDIGIEYLTGILRNNTTLQTLNLHNNQFRCKGIEHLNNALQNNPTLTALDISSNPLGEEGTEYLAELRRKNPELNISWLTILLSMENSSSSPRKGELVESMFKSLNSYTSELQQELEILNRKVADQIRIEQTYNTSQEQLQDDLIKLRAAIETNTVKRSILDRNLNERTNMSQLLHTQIVEKRQEQNIILDKTNTVKYNHHRNIAKITEQCANLTMAFRTNYHAYARADLDEIRKKTEIRLKIISAEVTNAELTVVDNKDKLIELNKKLDREIKHFNYLKESMEIIAKKLQLDDEDMINFDNLEKQLANIQILINELEAWHTRTNYPSEN